VSRFVVGVHLAAPGASASVAVIDLAERVTLFSEIDEQRSVELALARGAPWAHASHRGEVKRRERSYAVVHLEQFARGVAYAEIAQRLAVVRTPHGPLREAPLVVDVSAVGRAAEDELRAGAGSLTALTVTPGDSDAPGTIALPDLWALVMTALQTGRLRIAAALPLADALGEELRGFGQRPGGLALATAVGCWRGERVHAPEDWPAIR
jgi:hypothetical protein